jgi:iron complex transport system substrate-binding protein
MTAPHRVVSLLASGSELVCALGAGEMLVGRSHECDHPEWVKRLPSVSRPTFDITGTSQEIDARVRQRLHAKLPLYEVDEAAVAALGADVLITQTHCEVCAVSPADLAHATPPTLLRNQVVALETGSLAAILEGFRAVAKVLDLGDACDALIGAIRARMAELEAATRDLPRPTVVCLEWIDPIFAMGNWGPEIVEMAGGTSLLGNAGQHSTSIPWEAVRTADPEVLVVAPCGFGVERTLTEMHVFPALAGWRDMRAVREGKVFVADGNIYFNRSGPSVFETPRVLAEMLHGGRIPQKHEGAAWRKWAG